jgi:hypothetical protein
MSEKITTELNLNREEIEMEHNCPNCREPLAENLGFRQEVSANEFNVNLDASGDLEYTLIEDFELSQDGVYFCRNCDAELPLNDDGALAILKAAQTITAQN